MVEIFKNYLWWEGVILGLISPLSGRLGMTISLDFGKIAGQGRTHFKTFFQNCFLNSEQKGEVICNMDSWIDNKWVWDFKWRREWFVWERTINLAWEDHWLWLENKSTLFTVKSVYLALYELRIGSCEVDIFKNLWQIHIPPKVSFLLWRILLDGILTKINQKKGKYIYKIMSICVFCNESLEDTFHLFFTCRISCHLEKVVQFFRIQFSSSSINFGAFLETFT